MWAKVRFTPEDDGLLLPWHGKVFMNPPYGRQIGLWTKKAKAEVERDHAQIVVALLPARTDTCWWHKDVAGSADVFFLRGRLRFGDGNQSAPFPSAVVVWGALSEIRDALKLALPNAWQPT